MAADADGVGWALAEAVATGESGSSWVRGSPESTEAERDERRETAVFIFLGAAEELDAALLLIVVRGA